MASSIRIRHRGNEIVVDPGREATVGTDPGSTLVVPHPGISRNHAVVRHEGTWILEDLGSTNGTFRNGERVDRVRVTGPTTVVLGHPAQGEPIDLLPGDASGATESAASVADLVAVSRRLVWATWALAAVAVAAIVVAVVVLLVD